MALFPEPEYDTTRSLGHRVGRLVRAMQADLDRRFSGSGINHADWCVLAHVGDGHRKVTEIARSARLDPAAISRVVRRLRDRGLLEGRPDPADGRALELRLTARARRRMPVWKAAIFAVNTAFLAPLADDERETLLALLNRILAAEEDRGADETATDPSPDDR